MEITGPCFWLRIPNFSRQGHCQHSSIPPTGNLLRSGAPAGCVAVGQSYTLGNPEINMCSQLPAQIGCLVMFGYRYAALPTASCPVCTMSWPSSPFLAHLLPTTQLIYTISTPYPAAETTHPHPGPPATAFDLPLPFLMHTSSPPHSPPPHSSPH